MAEKYISHGGKNIIDSPQKLEQYMNKTAKGFCTGMAKEAAKRLKQNTARLVYESYQPSMYDRTMEFLNSVVGPGFNGGESTRRTSTGFESVVKFDPDMMTAFAPEHGLWGTHSSFDGDDAQEAVIEGFEEGGFEVWGGRGGNVHLIYQRNPVHMLEITAEEIGNAIDGINREIENPELELEDFIIRIGT